MANQTKAEKIQINILDKFHGQAEITVGDEVFWMEELSRTTLTQIWGDCGLDYLREVVNVEIRLAGEPLVEYGIEHTYKLNKNNPITKYTYQNLVETDNLFTTVAQVLALQ